MQSLDKCQLGQVVRDKANKLHSVGEFFFFIFIFHNARLTTP